jgi:hypothetical protein
MEIGGARHPKWATAKGMKLSEDVGGRFFCFDVHLSLKLYVFPFFKVEFVSQYVQKPRGYVTPTRAKAIGAKSVVKKKKVIKIVEKEQW